MRSCIFLCIFLIPAMDGYSGSKSETGNAGNHSSKIGVSKLREVFAWKRFTFEGLGLAGQSGNVIDVPMGLAVWKNKVFLGFPRRRQGVPVGLGYINLSGSKNSTSPSVKSYPSATLNDINAPGSNGRIVSVSRPAVDSCNRLWLFDTGFVFSSGQRQRVQSPTILVFDLLTDTLVKNFTFISEQTLLSTYDLVSITIDIPGDDCTDAYAYVADVRASAIYVYSLKNNDSWRVRNNLMNLDPTHGDFSLPNLNWQWSDGVFGIALSPCIKGELYRTVYFHAMCSYYERAVSSEVLRNKTLATRSYHGSDFRTVGYRGPNTQSNTHAISPSTGVMFAAQVGTNALSCWNTATPLRPENNGIVAQDDELLIYPSDMKIDANEKIWVLSNKFPYYAFSTLNPDDINFRIYAVRVADAIRGTICESE